MVCSFGGGGGVPGVATGGQQRAPLLGPVGSKGREVWAVTFGVMTAPVMDHIISLDSGSGPARVRPSRRKDRRFHSLSVLIHTHIYTCVTWSRNQPVLKEQHRSAPRS